MRLTIQNLSDLRMDSVADIRPAVEAFRDAISAVLPLQIAPWHNIASSHPMVDAQGRNLLVEVFGWSDEPEICWWKRQPASLDQVSPMVAACRLHTEPFWCSEAGFFTHCPNPLVDTLSWESFFERVGLHAAIVVPVHLPFGQIGATSFSSSDPSFTNLEELFNLWGDLVGLFSRRLISGYVNVTATPRNLPADLRLTRREVECLHWAALGKTNEEITMILALSLSTVRFHIANAAEKLNAINRSQAVLKAAQLGFIKNPGA